MSLWTIRKGRKKEKEHTKKEKKHTRRREMVSEQPSSTAEIR
jgi:hypothetical protein